MSKKKLEKSSKTKVDTSDTEINKIIKPDASPTTSYNYFQGHDCHLPPEKLSAYMITSKGIALWIFNFMAVHTGDIRAINMHRDTLSFIVSALSWWSPLLIMTLLYFLLPRSYAAFCAEKYRHHKHHRCTIHPYSKLRLILELTFVVLTVVGSIIITVHFATNDYHGNVHYLQSEITYFCDVMIVFNIIANFFTGYIEGLSQKVAVLSMKKIALRYLKTWLIADLLACMGVLFEIHYVEHITVILIMESIKIIRIPIILVYLENILTVMRASFLQKVVVEALYLLILYLSWNIYFQFAVEYMIEGSYYPENPRNCSWLTVGKLWNQTTSVRLIYAFDRSIGMLTTSTNMNILSQKNCLENFLIVYWIFSKIFIFHYAQKYTLACFGKEAASAQYYMMKKQLETYMVQRNFLPRLKSKILKFYAIRFQYKFFEESRMLGCVSGQLREDILMHTGRQLVRELDFLKQLPSSLLVQIAVKLRLVIYIAGDIIFKINTVGDCLYFIDRGTVAIYSDSGKEICHLEDGDYFGEIALVMKHHFRTASVVAVTNCELFRLDREHFETTIAHYPTVYNSIKEVATTRFERTRVIDEHHKAELKTNELWHLQ